MLPHLCADYELGELNYRKFIEYHIMSTFLTALAARAGYKLVDSQLENGIFKYLFVQDPGWPQMKE